MEIGKRIRELRTARHMSQEALAGELNISRQAVAKWESGAAMPSTANLLALCRVFGIELTELLREDEEGSSGEAEPRGEEEAGTRKPGRFRRFLPLLLLLLAAALEALSCWVRRTPHVSGSVGIIGGADGPTHIYVTGGGPSELLHILALACLLLACAAAVRRLLRRRKKDK